jgi:3-oxocholest-4-en-26-oyl-CoA dehydrogenase beta subunit
MDFGLTDEQEALRQLAARILGDRMTLERLKTIEATADVFDRDTWEELARANLLGIAVPEARGGLGFGFLELCLLLVEVGRAVAPLPALATLVSAALPLAEFGTSEQQDRWLPGVASGELVLTAGLTELGTPPDQPTTRARRDGGGWRVDGVKVNVPAAHLADVMLIPARTDAGEVGVFLVDLAAAGVVLERQDTMSREPQFRVELDGVLVRDGEVLGGLERGAEVLGWIVDRTVVGLCAIGTGVAAEALRLTAEYTTTRKQFDRAIGTFQAVGQRLADAYIDAEAINLTMLQAATHLAEGQAATLEVATAKFWASEGGSRVAHAALHVHGGISIDVDFPIHRYFLWAKVIEFSLGAGTPQLARIGAVLAAEPA